MQVMLQLIQLQESQLDQPELPDNLFKLVKSLSDWSKIEDDA